MEQPLRKFRAWHKDKKKFHYFAMPDLFYFGEQTFAQVRQDWMNDRYGVFQQNTEVKDKDGKEIYEGDIVSVEYGVGEVVFQSGCFMIQWLDDKEAMLELLSMEKSKYGRIRKDLKIIGDIYENFTTVKK